MKDRKNEYSNLVQIDIKEISLEPGPFSMSFGFDLDPLISSMEKIGILNPPLIIRGKSVVVVTGYRRILAAEKLGWENVWCIDITGAGYTEFELLLLNLHDNLTTREFNNIEKSMILVRLLRYLSIDDVRRDYSKILKINKPSDMEILIKADEFDPLIKESIAEGVINLGIATRVNTIDNTSKNLLINLFHKLRLSINYQTQLLDNLFDISHTKQISISDLLNTDEIRGFLEINNLNNPQQSKRLIDVLRCMRYPIITQAERTFSNIVSKISLPKGVKIIHPPSFESPGFIAEISFQNGKELISKIKDMADKRGLEKLTDPWEC
jgi:hypothetical protein